MTHKTAHRRSKLRKHPLDGDVSALTAHKSLAHESMNQGVVLHNTASAVSHRRRKTQIAHEQRFDRKLPHIGSAARKPPLALEDESSLEARRRTNNVVDR